MYRTKFEESPAGLIAFLGRKLLRLWYATESGRYHRLTIPINAAALVLAAVGLGRAGSRRQSEALVLLIPVVYFTAISLFG